MYYDYENKTWDHEQPDCSVDEIQDGRFEAVEVEVEEVRRNKTTLSCAILLELAA